MPPIGVFCVSDLIGRHLAAVCQYKKILIPQEAGLIGAHNEPDFCLLANPSISSIDFGLKQLGYRAAILLDDLLEGKPAPGDPIELPPALLVPRQSTDAYVVDDPLVAEGLRFIAEHSHEPIKVGDVTRGIGVSRRTLERRFTESSRAEHVLPGRICVSWFGSWRLGSSVFFGTLRPIASHTHETT